MRTLARVLAVPALTAVLFTGFTGQLPGALWHPVAGDGTVGGYRPACPAPRATAPPAARRSHGPTAAPGLPTRLLALSVSDLSHLLAF
jgi:hypothetical protein